MSNNERPLSSEERLARLAARTADRRPSAGPRTSPNGSQPSAAKPARRRHAAQGSRTAALTLSAVTTVGLAAWLQVDSSTSTIDASGTISGSTDTGTTSSSTETASTESAATEAASVATADTTSTSSSGLADGTYTGDSSSTKWGDVQVQITVSDGVITDVTVLDYPADDNKSVQISQRSLPTLISETLANQSAEVDSVSGATYTSRAYTSSLQSAIDAATAEASA